MPLYFTYLINRFTHLQHIPFTYSIGVTNDKKTQTRGTVRIFLSTKYDENGKEWTFKEQRLQMAEMDRFTVNCEYCYLI